MDTSEGNTLSTVTSHSFKGYAVGRTKDMVIGLLTGPRMSCEICRDVSQHVLSLVHLQSRGYQPFQTKACPPSCRR